MRAPSSSLYKDTTFFLEIQIALTFRNSLQNVKMQRFAADGVARMLYYEGAGYSPFAERGGAAFMGYEWMG